MREFRGLHSVKFRAWDSKNKSMESPCEDDELCDYIEGMISRCGEENLLQYTGIKDETGKELCRGDICHVETIGNCEVEICSLFGTIFRRGCYDYPVVEIIYKKGSFKVIGNKYENPELLEKGGVNEN